MATPSQDGLSDRRGDASRPGHFDNEQSSPGRGANPYPDLGSASQEAWGLVLDELRDPGNLGAILRIADWYRIPTLVCSPTTVDSVQSQGAAGQHGVFPARSGTYTPLPAWLSSTSQPIGGTFTAGDNLHHTPLPCPSWIVIGNEAQG